MALLAVVLVTVLLIFNVASYNSQYRSTMSALNSALIAGPSGLNVPRIGGLDDDISSSSNSGTSSTKSSKSGSSQSEGSQSSGGSGSSSGSSSSSSSSSGSGSSGGTNGSDPSTNDNTENSDTNTTPQSEEKSYSGSSDLGLSIGSGISKDISTSDTSIPVYCVSIAADGTIKAASKNAYMSANLVTQALEEIGQIGQNSGELTSAGLFYSVSEYKNEVRIAFADSTTLHADTFGRIIFSLLVGAGTLGVLFLVCLWLSRFTLKPVRQAWDGQQRFIADASHELKTPLTVILANNDIVLSHSDATVEEQRRWIESTSEEAERMQGLVKDLLVLAQTEPDNIQTFRANLQLEVLDFSSIVEMDILQFEAVAFDKGVEMEEQIEEGLMVRADSDKLERVIRVLLDNACKYAASAGDKENAGFGEESSGGYGVAGLDAAKPSLGDFDAASEGANSAENGVGDYNIDKASRPSPEETGALIASPNGLVAPAVFTTRANYVKVCLYREKSYGILTVNNGGEPISPHDLPHIFEKFYRSDKARTGKTEGYGLGLSIAKNIVEGFGGTIEVDSNIFDGTTFTVRLPLV